MSKILLTYGHKKRDFENLCLLAAVLEKKGFTVKLQYSNFELYSSLFFWRPDFLFLGQVNQNENIAYAKYAQQLGITVVILNCEGTYDETKYDHLFGSPEYFDFMFAWGTQQKSDLVKIDHIPVKKIITTGTPKFDVYHPRVFESNLYPKPYQEFLNPHKKTIVIATSFPLAETAWKQVAQNLAYQELGQHQFEEIMTSQQELRKQYIRLAIELSKLNKYNIVFRIHPTESSHFYGQKLKKIKGVIVDNNVSTPCLFKVSDILIHRTSTIATEAWIKNIFTISFDPLPGKQTDLFPFTQLDLRFKDCAKLVDFLNQSKTFKAEKQLAQRRDYLQRWYSLRIDDADLAAERIAQVIGEKFKKNQAPVRNFVFRYEIFVVFLLNICRSILRKKYLYEVIGIMKKEPYLSLMKQNFCTELEVNERKQAFKQVIYEPLASCNQPM